MKDPHEDGKKAPRQSIAPVSRSFGEIVGLIDRMQRSDSDEKQEAIVSNKLERHIPDLDLEFMKRWARALPVMRPKLQRGSKAPVVVTTSDPQVTIELVATDDAFAQLKTVFDKLDENAKNSFVLVQLGKDAVLDVAVVSESGKPGLVEADAGKIDTGAGWRAKLENVATLFKDKVATANVPPDAKAAAAAKKAAPIRSVKRDPKDRQITLQPVFEKVVPKGLDAVAFQPSHSCEMPTPGRGEPLEWWHYQHDSSHDVLYPDMLAQIGYAASFLFLPREPPLQDAPGGYAGRGIGANPVQEKRFSYWGVPHEPENSESPGAEATW